MIPRVFEYFIFKYHKKNLILKTESRFLSWKQCNDIKEAGVVRKQLILNKLQY